MNTQRATDLLERYFAGETSQREETELQQYFQRGEPAEEHLPYAPLFAYWERERSIRAPARLTGLGPRRRPYHWLLGIAAGFALLLLAHWVYQTQGPPLSTFPVAERQPVDWSRYEITDEEEALRFVRDVLHTTSTQLQRGPEITVRELREVHQILD